MLGWRSVTCKEISALKQRSPASVSRERRSRLTAHGVPDHVNGILLTSVAPAAAAALAEGDVLTRIDGRRIADDGQARARRRGARTGRANARARRRGGARAS